MRTELNAFFFKNAQMSFNGIFVYLLKFYLEIKIVLNDLKMWSIVISNVKNSREPFKTTSADLGGKYWFR